MRLGFLTVDSSLLALFFESPNLKLNLISVGGVPTLSLKVDFGLELACLGVSLLLLNASLDL